MTSKIALITAALFAATLATAQAEGNGEPFPPPAGSGVISTTHTSAFLPENGSNGIVQTENSAPRTFGPSAARPIVTAQHAPSQRG